MLQVRGIQAHFVAVSRHLSSGIVHQDVYLCRCLVYFGGGSGRVMSPCRWYAYDTGLLFSCRRYNRPVLRGVYLRTVLPFRCSYYSLGLCFEYPGAVASSTCLVRSYSQ